MLQYRNTSKSAQQIGQELNAGSILEGSVRHQGDRIRVVAQLIDTRSHVFPADERVVVVGKRLGSFYENAVAGEGGGSSYKLPAT